MKNRVRDVILRRSAFIIMLLMVLGAIALLRIVSTHKDVEDVAEIDLPLIETLTRIETNQLEQSINFERAVRYGIEQDNSASWQDFIESDSLFRYLAKVVDEDLIRAEKQVEDAMQTTQQKAQQNSLKILHLYVKKLEADHTSYENHAINVMRHLEEGNVEQAVLMIDKVEEEEDQFNKQVEGVLMRHEMFTETLMKMVEQEEVISMKWVVSLTLVFVILSLVAVYTFSYKVWRPLEDIRAGAERLGSGQLNERVKLRSNSITEDVVDSFNTMADQLQAAQKNIDKFINFSYQSSHDLKAPIENLKSLLDMLDRENISASHYDTVLNNAKKSANKLETTVNALSDFNQIREHLGARKEHLNFEDVFKEAAGSLIEEIKESGALVKKNFSVCPKIFYPKPQLLSIFHHLLSNSIQYRNPDKRLMIELMTKKVGDHIMLIIRDNGLGFDSIKYGEEMLKPFIRLHSHTEGTGLGLHIVNTILEYHGGSIKVESKPKRGAKFTLQLT